MKVDQELDLRLLSIILCIGKRTRPWKTHNDDESSIPAIKAASPGILSKYFAQDRLLVDT